MLVREFLAARDVRTVRAPSNRLTVEELKACISSRDYRDISQRSKSELVSIFETIMENESKPQAGPARIRMPDSTSLDMVFAFPQYTNRSERFMPTTVPLPPLSKFVTDINYMSATMPILT